jgi:hypothetical protein
MYQRYNRTAMTDDERRIREATFKVQFERELPEFAQMRSSAVEVVILHQGAFAADYQESEFCLLGRVINYAGLLGKENECGVHSGY